MPSRTLFGALVRSSSSSPKFDNINSNPHSPATHHSLLPPEYYLHTPPKSRSQESLVSMEALKRHSLVPRHSDKKSPKVHPHKPAKLDMIVESPPLVMYNGPQASTGALFSGQLSLTVIDPEVKLEKFEMQLLAVVSTKRPVVPHCQDCANKTSEIHKWEFLEAPISLKMGDHYFPFSHLLPGHLPATTHGHIASIDYHLEAVAITSTGEKITYSRDLLIKRAIMPGNDKHSIRIFPPTNLTASVTLPPVIHSIGEFPVEMRLSGIITNKEQAQTRWVLRKLNWRIEETQRFTAPVCAKHATKLGGENRGVKNEDVRTVGHAEVKHGWKSDFQEGNIDVQFHASCDMALKPTCDMDSASGMDVKHNLIVEMVVAEEWAPLKKPNQATPTGSARVLRTQFHVILTERAGLGISWDEEQPPMYEDVPASPPTYMEDIDASHLSDDSDGLYHI
ncbi:hypothetical protein GQ43DRAFT_439614 [Delitschia confertaspora ATCC 74209]|uniref:LDB19 N-terminal domain-containing protein n=1 Tax=Delitschia confertaspora ATCC 74209 TaxID=1513339 RepID=A0A9P4JNA6_9PLEO|nr:hypothetical protein GQ43DRAFT_439614 [Delitschia confertaspora ATCC 74209]